MTLTCGEVIINHGGAVLPRRSATRDTILGRFSRLGVTMGGNWRHHPGVRSEKGELSLGERAADRMRNGMGSWAFVFAAMGFLAAWMGYNGHRGFDAYPFILLNLVLSCLAAMQGAILLIAAKRQDQISSELAQHDYQTNLDAKAILEALVAHVGGDRPVCTVCWQQPGNDCLHFVVR